MTTAARPTWAPAKGGNEQGGTRIFGPSQKYSSRDIAAHTTLKPRKEGQDTQDELQRRNLRDELEDRERRHFSSKEDRERRKGGHLLLEGSRRELEDRIVPRSVDADDADVDAPSDESEDDDEDDGDDEEELLAELERIRKEKAEQKEREEHQRQEEELKVKEEQLLHGNPLLNNPTSFSVKRRWDDDVVFKNQARGETKLTKRFINDTIGDDDMDRISLLPVEILVDILSLLSTEEAVRTSVLSSRWINLWEHTNCLNLDPDTSALLFGVSGISAIYAKLASEGPKYVRWVNRILQSHKAPTLKEFRIKFPFIFDTNATKSIARWLEFAFARHVQRLDLDLTSDYPFQSIYCFPEELLASPSGSPSMLLDFRCLRVLSFTNVNVTDRVIDFFLRNCPLLEQLVVRLSRKLSNVEVCGSSLVLKHLEIAHCLGLKSLKVSALRLTHLKVLGAYGGPLLVGNAPMLVETRIDCNLEDIQRLFSTLSSRVSQLEILHLMVLGYEGKGKGATSKLPELPKLNKLWIEHVVPEPECFVSLVDLIRASPRLEEFVLENGFLEGLPPWKNEVVEDAIKSPHHHLKVVKYFGYCGFAADLQFVSYILENCVALETLMIELSVFSILKSKSRRRHSSPKEKLECGEDGRNNLKRQLEALVPRHVALVFL